MRSESGDNGLSVGGRGGGHSLIAFSRWMPGDGEQIFTMLADGGGIRQLTGDEGQGSNWCPAWSPDATRICFTSSRNRYSRIYVMSAHGSDQRQLTAGEGGDDFAPDWSPDGASIVFERGDGGADALYLLEVRSGRQRPLTASGSLDSAGAWSPDGTLIAFRRSWTRPAGLYVMRADGGEARFLTPGNHPRWSPDGGRVAYSHAGAIWVLPVDGAGRARGEPRQLTSNPQGHDRHPCWSPDGGRLALEREALRGCKVEHRIVTMDATGDDIRDLCEGHGPAWSPPLP